MVTPFDGAGNFIFGLMSNGLDLDGTLILTEVDSLSSTKKTASWWDVPVHLAYKTAKIVEYRDGLVTDSILIGHIDECERVLVDSFVFLLEEFPEAAKHLLESGKYAILRVNSLDDLSDIKKDGFEFAPDINFTQEVLDYNRVTEIAYPEVVSLARSHRHYSVLKLMK